MRQATQLQGGYTQYRKQFLKNLLIPRFDNGEPLHRAIVELQMTAELISRRVQELTADHLRAELLYALDECESDIESVVGMIYDGSDLNLTDSGRAQSVLDRIQSRLNSLPQAPRVGIRRNNR